MEDLPAPIVAEILGLLKDSSDLANCRLASRYLCSASYAVRSVRLSCSSTRILASRTGAAAAAAAIYTPFKSVVVNLVSLLRDLESLSISVEGHSADAVEEDYSDDADDLHLTAEGFLYSWIPGAAGKLKSLSISDYWIQSCWRKSEALSVISDLCCNLVHLELRNAWLTVEGLKPMMNLTSLILEYVRLEDEDLQNVNECFPSLQVLKLLGVGGLREPMINLPELRTFSWTISNYPTSLSIKAPRLVELKLLCVQPELLLLNAPSLCNLDLTIKKPIGVVRIGDLQFLESLRAVSMDLCGLIRIFNGINSVTKLELEGITGDCRSVLPRRLTFYDVIAAFPNINNLNLLPGVWDQLDAAAGLTVRDPKLNCLTMYLPSLDFELASSVLGLCTSNCKVTVFTRHGSSDTTPCLALKCETKFPKIRWQWGFWEEKFDGVAQVKGSSQ